ncbi:MAG TPA: hypothetical protein VGS28_01670 [Candidatus Saccharimonadales bacterium]|nr:hypothetical protein [Candidatus Saccharimonadales bacterium]
MSARKNSKKSQKAYKPKPPKVGTDVGEEEKRYKAFTELAIKGGAELRKKLKLSEDAFSLVYGPNTGNPKKYYLTGVLNEVEKAGMAMMYTADFVVESKKKPEPEITDATGYRIANNAIQVKIDELTVSERKLTETLVDLVGFRRADEADYYRHYIVLHELDAKKKIQNDMHEFSGVKSKNLAFQIEELEKQADALAAKLDPAKCWYAKKRRGVLTRNISTFSERFKEVFPYMKEYEQATLYTYGASFGRQSGFLHSGKPVERRKLTLNTLGAHVGRIGTLAPGVLTATKDLGHLNNVKGILKTISDVTKKNDYPIKLFRQKTKPKIVEGDFVVTVWGSLGQVTKVIKSKYGYKSFRVKYLTDMPLPDMPVDDFPAENVRLVYARKPLVEQLRQEIHKATPELKPGTRELNKLMTESVLHLWNNVGLKEFTLNNPKAGYEKIQQEIDRINSPKK